MKESKLKQLGSKIKRGAAKAYNAVKPWIAPMLVVTTISAAWDAYSQSRRNEREIRELQRKIDHTEINITLVPKEDEPEETEKMAEDNTKLLEEALDITEGKEELSA